MGKKITLSILLTAALLCCANAAQPTITIVSQGKPKAVIVLPSRPSRAAVQGAEILADHLEQISGARLKVLNESVLVDAEIVDGRINVPSRQATTDTFILVGESELAKNLGQNSKGLGPGGILIRTVGNALVLLGPDDKTPADPYGTRYAVTTFLEDQLGCRWAHQAGYDATAAIAVLQKFQEIQGKEPNDFEIMFMSHPGNEDRVNVVKATLEQYGISGAYHP